MITKLNNNQRLAIEHGSGPLLIIAGAGTGKTTVITERIKHLITKGLAKPEEILALTFTEKAASEMEERVDVAMPLSYGDIWIMTFHSFCDQILRNEALHIGLPSNFKLMTEAESLDLFKKNLFNFSLDYFRPLGNPNKFIGEILKHFSRLQDEVITPDDYIGWVKGKRQELKDTQEAVLEQQKWEELATVYKEYDELKANEARFDFGDLIIKTIELFKKRPNILNKYREKFKYILVDEYQDTNFAQNELVKLLVNDDGNITVVSDDDQSIYRFRGASVSNILQFRKNFPKTKNIVLSQNYRSTQEILDKSYEMIQHNNPDRLEVIEGINKKLISVDKSKGHEIEFIHTPNVQEESEKVVEIINQLVSESVNHYQWKDIAILVRANAHADPFIRELERRGIPNQFLGPSKLFEKEEVVDLISYLRVLQDVNDSQNLYRFLSSRFLKIAPLDLIKINHLAKRQSLSIFDIVASKDLDVGVKTKEMIDKILETINKHLLDAKDKTAGEILFDFINIFGVYEDILKNEEDIKGKNISSFFNRIKDYENQNPSTSLRAGPNSINAVVDYIDLLTETGESPIVSAGDWQEINAINILTVHSAKGLEFPVVFLVNLVNERFPGRKRGESLPIPNELIKEELPVGDFHLEEERRLFYVGMTRAKERLYFSASDYYGDGKRKKKISPFVTESLGEQPNSQTTRQLDNLAPRQLDIHISERQGVKVSRSSDVKIEYLSYSQIETFQTCPLHYKLKYIYKIPTKETASQSFGTSIHNTLREFYQAVNNQPSFAKADSIATRAKERANLEKIILEMFARNWVTEGYENKSHKEKFYQKGKDYLLGYLKNGFHPEIKTLTTEQTFVVPLSTKYSVLGTRSLKIGGRIDRVDDLGNGSIEIIDYKTGAKLPTQKEVDKNLQLSFYALAATKIASALFGKSPEQIKLSLYYLDTQEKISTTRTAKDLENAADEISEIRNEIEQSDFKCNNNFFCQQGCEFKVFCKS